MKKKTRPLEDILVSLREQDIKLERDDEHGEFSVQVYKNKQNIGTFQWNYINKKAHSYYVFDGPGFQSLRPSEKNLIDELYKANGGKILNANEYAQHNSQE